MKEWTAQINYSAKFRRFIIGGRQGAFSALPKYSVQSLFDVRYPPKTQGSCQLSPINQSKSISRGYRLPAFLYCKSSLRQTANLLWTAETNPAMLHCSLRNIQYYKFTGFAPFFILDKYFDTNDNNS
jgi:hypothetical protein